MINFLERENSIQIEKDGTKTVFPKGVLSAHTEEGSNSIELRLMASRKNIYSFNFDDTNLEGDDASTVLENIEKII